MCCFVVVNKQTMKSFTFHYLNVVDRWRGGQVGPESWRRLNSTWNRTKALLCFLWRGFSIYNLTKTSPCFLWRLPLIFSCLCRSLFIGIVPSPLCFSLATVRDSHFRPDSVVTADMGFVSSPVKVFVLNIRWAESQDGKKNNPEETLK